MSKEEIIKRLKKHLEWENNAIDIDAIREAINMLEQGKESTQEMRREMKGEENEES